MVVFTSQPQGIIYFILDYDQKITFACQRMFKIPSDGTEHEKCFLFGELVNIAHVCKTTSS